MLKYILNTVQYYTEDINLYNNVVVFCKTVLYLVYVSCKGTLHTVQWF